MTSEDDKFEKVKDYLWGCRAAFCLIYRTQSEGGEKVEWIRAMSDAIKTREDCEKLAAKYNDLALYRYKEKRSAVLEEKKGTSGVPWFGFEIPTGEITTYRENSLGQRWWTLVIVSGVAPQHGYVIVTRILAKNSLECRKLITDLQALIKKNS